MPRFSRPSISALSPALVCVLAAAVYLNTLRNPFVFDDVLEVVENESIGDVSDLPRIVTGYRTRPLTNVSYALDFARTGLDPRGYHETNILLHALNTFLLFVLARRWFELFAPDDGAGGSTVGTLAAATAASLFAVHPLLSGAVGYVSARAELLAATGMLANLTVLYGRAPCEERPSWTAVAPAGLFFGLALGAKETAVMLPVVYALAEFLLRPAMARHRLLRIHLPLILGVMILAAVRIAWYTTDEQAASAAWQWQNLAITLHAVERYLALLCMPVSLSLVPEVVPLTSWLDPRLWRAVGAIALIGAIAILGRSRHALITVGLAWFLLLLVPSAMIVLLATVGQPMAEHRVYVASAGFFMAVAALVWQFDAVRRQPALTVVLLGLVVAVLAGLTVQRNRVWSDPVRLWEDAAAKAPRTWMAQYGAADAHRRADACESASGFYERAIALRPSEIAAYTGLATCLRTLGRPRQAKQVLEPAIARRPEEAGPRLDLAVLEGTVLQNPAEAVRLCRGVLAQDPGHEAARDCLRRYHAGGSPH